MPSHTPDHCHGKHCTLGCRHPHPTHVPHPWLPPGKGSITQFPHFSKEATPSLLQSGSFSAGREGGGRLGESDTCQCLTVYPSPLEGERFAKRGKIPERRGRAQEGPYMDMGTASCFSAGAYVAAPASPRAIHRPQALGQHCATKEYRSHCCPSAVPQAGVQVTAGVQVLSATAQLCLLTASSPPKGHGIPQHPPHTSQCVPPTPSPSHP